MKDSKSGCEWNNGTIFISGFIIRYLFFDKFIVYSILVDRSIDGQLIFEHFNLKIWVRKLTKGYFGIRLTLLVD